MYGHCESLFIRNIYNEFKVSPPLITDILMDKKFTRRSFYTRTFIYLSLITAKKLHRWRKSLLNNISIFTINDHWNTFIKMIKK